jgi:hypothetical protein
MHTGPKPSHTRPTPTSPTSSDRRLSSHTLHAEPGPALDWSERAYAIARAAYPRSPRLDPRTHFRRPVHLEGLNESP